MCFFEYHSLYSSSRPSPGADSTTIMALGTSLVYGCSGLAPVAKVGLNGPSLDRLGVRPWSDRGVGLESCHGGVEFKRALPPFRESDPTVTNVEQPVGRLALDRKVECAGGDQLDALEAEPGAVHGVLGVVAVLADQFLATSAA